MAHEHIKPGVVIDLMSFGESRSTALVKQKEFEVIRLVVEPGKPIPAHQVNGPITVQCLSGTCTFFVGDQPQTLVPGSWLYLSGGTSHALESTEQAILLVTILFSKA